jgi:cytochrome c peroxidase
VRAGAVALLALLAASPARYLRTLAHDPGGYDPERAGGAPTDLLLGDLLFHSPGTLGPVAEREGISCDTCHPNGAANTTLMLPAGLSDRPGNVDLTTGHFRAGADNRIADFLNVPSLRGARYTAPYGWDGRAASLGDFVADVVSGEFGGAPLSAGERRALVAYVRDLDFLPNPNLDRRGRLTERASAAAHRGEVLFTATRPGLDGAACATCHPPSAFFRDGRVHRLGSGGVPPSPHAIEDGYETPTLLGLTETAPYFHDGRHATLGDVVAWFDRDFALGLTTDERADLVAYLEAVGSCEGGPRERPRAQQMIDRFVYLALLVDGEWRDDRRVWALALAAATVELARHPPAPAPPVAARAADARARLARLADRTRAGAPLEPLRPEAARLRKDLFRLAADWAGALDAN